MTEPKQFYFDELVKGNILSFIPTKEYFKRGHFTIRCSFLMTKLLELVKRIIP